MSDTHGGAKRTIRGFRRVAVVAVVVSLAAAAALGIVALFSGDFGETQGKILGTTLLTGAFGVAALCHLAVVARPVRVVGILGLAVTAIAYAIGLMLVWRSGDADYDLLLRAFGAAWVLAASFAHANLLLLMGRRRSRLLRIGLTATLVFVAVVAGMLLVPILTDGAIPGDGRDPYWRWFGAVAILDALGTIVVPIAALFLRDGRDRGAEDSITVTLSGDTALRARRLAAERGEPVDRMLADLVDGLPARPGAPAQDRP